MNRLLLVTTASIVLCYTAAAQWKAGVEQYSYMGTPFTGAIVPVFHIQSKNNWYAELRYNYEEAQTFSVFGGKAIKGGHDLEYSITPMAGFSTGRFTGISLATNIEAEWKNIYLSSETQYSQAIKKDAKSFFFNWSDLGYTLNRRFFAGMTMQYTRQAGEIDCKPGLLAGISFSSLSFPFYLFNPFRGNSYLVLGANYEYSFKKKARPLYSKKYL
jgi:hypothetical protein